MFARLCSLVLCVVSVAILQFWFCVSFIDDFFLWISFKTAEWLCRGDTLSVCVCERKCPMLCFVIEIYLFIYGFLSFNLILYFLWKEYADYFWLTSWPSFCWVMKTQMPKSSTGRRALNHCWHFSLHNIAWA